MNDWRDATHRRNGTEAFCKFLHDPVNLQVREGCTIAQETTNPGAAYAKAKDVFAKQGGFVKEEDFPAGSAPKEAIPKIVEFRVYEEDIYPRDNLVTIVLPRRDQPLPTGASFDVTDIYRCTWSPWASLLALAHEPPRP
jgi:hypothetical protein